MVRMFIVTAIGLISGLILTPAKSDDRPAPLDLFDGGLKDWSRTGDGPTPWKFTADRVLTSDGAADSYQPEREFRDGTLHVEWRLKPGKDDKVKPRASVGVREVANGGGSGCKILLGERTGTIAATHTTGSDRIKLSEVEAVKDHAKPGEWNTLDVNLQGKKVTVSVNGQKAATFDNCDADSGLISLDSLGFAVEFRKVTWTAAE